MRQHLLFHEDTMTPAITFEELLAWNCQSSDFWMAHLDANPALLQLPSGIGGTADVQALVRHIWGVELLWSQRIAGLPERNKEVWPAGPLHALFDLHLEAVVNFRNLLDDPGKSWDLRLILDRPGIPPEVSRPTTERFLDMRFCTASDTGRNCLRWSALPDFHPGSRTTCSSAQLWDRFRRGGGNGSRRHRLSTLLLETRPAKHRPALRRLERHGRFLAALGARCPRLRAHPGTAAHTFRLALLTVLGIVFELLIVEKQLLASCEHKIGSAIVALQYSVDEFHDRLP
jgi:hypothetical protein